MSLPGQMNGVATCPECGVVVGHKVTCASIPDEFWIRWFLAPKEPSLCWDVKVGWVPVRAIDPATGRCYVDDSAPTYEAPE